MRNPLNRYAWLSEGSRVFVVCCGVFFSIVTASFARDIGYQDLHGNWRIMDELADPDGLMARQLDGRSKMEQTHQTAVNFTVTFDDVTQNNNMGFDDPAQGQARRDTLIAVLNYVDSILDHSGKADVFVTVSNNIANSGNLAHAGSIWFTSPNRFDNGFAFQHLTTGKDPSTNNPDIRVTVNFGKNWYASATGTPPSGSFDLYTVLLHEICHGLGFLSLITLNNDGTAVAGGLGGTTRVFTLYDKLLARNGALLFSTAGGATFLGSLNDLINNDLVFQSETAKAMYEAFHSGSGYPPLYSPSPYEEGSSVSHFEQSIPNNVIMTPFRSTGVAIRQLSPVDLGVLKDIGYKLKAGVEPPVAVEDWLQR